MQGKYHTCYAILLIGLLSWESASTSCSALHTFLLLAVTIASPSPALRISDWVVLNCSFSRPDHPASVHWFRGADRVPIQVSPHLYFAGSFLFLPQISLSDSGPWGCTLAYRDGFNVSITESFTILGNSTPLVSSLALTPSCSPATSSS